MMNMNMNKLSLSLLMGLSMMGVGQGFVVTPASPLKASASSVSVTQLSALPFDMMNSIDHINTIFETATSSSTVVLADAVADNLASPDYIPGTSGDVTYSKASYYAILTLYGLSFPGLWSTIKRSTKAKVKRKVYVSKGENALEGDGMGLRAQAGEIMAYMKANNYEVVDAGETIKFEGVVQRSVSQACFLVFCGAIGLASLALVLSIQFNSLELPIIGTPNWYYITLISPYAGIYYWRSGDRTDEFSIKLEANDDETENSINVMGSEDEIERMYKALEWQEKGMIKVEPLFGGAE